MRSLPVDQRETAIAGMILGTAVGDALGLPYEGLTARRGKRLLGPPERYRFLFGRGMVSDDTEHACLVMQALIASGNDPDLFGRRLARGLRLWLLGAPAGIGLATLRSTLRLCAGVPFSRSGVFSAGNGPAMRSPILGACLEDRDQLRRFVRISTRMTHTDPKAEYGAFAVALAAWTSRSGHAVAPQQYLDLLRETMPESDADEFFQLAAHVVQSIQDSQPTAEFVGELGLGRGVSGYIYHTVPVALHVWLRHPQDFRAALTEVIQLGGDTDTAAAIVGALVGSAIGPAGIPAEWVTGLLEWPRTVGWLEALSRQLASVRNNGFPQRPLRLPIYGLLPRNLLFLTVVLAHGFRRLLPPY